MAQSSSSRNWDYDVFLSFRGEDVRGNIRTHLVKELEQKLITVFKDDAIQKGNSLTPELEKAIKNSRIAVVIFSANYASSSWCLNELLELVNCKEQKVIPVFYGVDPSDVRFQKNDFGRIFETTCEREPDKEEKKSQWKAALTNVANASDFINQSNTGESEVKESQWKKALTDVANTVGFDSKTWNDEAKMNEKIADVVLNILLPTQSKDFENFVGLEDHTAKMSDLLQLKSEKVKMIGIWGSSGIGKTSIARALFNQLSRNFQLTKFIDKAFVYKTKEIYCGANPDDHNMKLDLLKKFLSEILGRENIKIDHLNAVEERLKHRKVLLIIDDLDDLVVLETLVGKLNWFGSGSKIVVVTKDRQFLRSHDIDQYYEVSLPTEDRAIEILCQSAFKKKSPLDGFEELVVEVVRYVDRLPIALTVLGKDLRGRSKKYWTDMLPEIQHGIDSKTEKVLKVSYDGLDRDDKLIFRHIACLFNHYEVEDIKLFLADMRSLNNGLVRLEDKSLIHVREGHVEMHHLLQEMGRKLVGTIENLGDREFLVDSKDILEVLSENTGTQKVLGILWHIDQMHMWSLHKISFKGMSKLSFLKIDFNFFHWMSDKSMISESLDYLPHTLKLLCWPNYPLRCMAPGFSPENLVNLEMKESKLETLWEGVVTLSGLRSMNLSDSKNLKQIPDLSRAINLEELNFWGCWSLVELPSSIRNLNKLLKLDMGCCFRLKILPNGFNLKSLNYLDFGGCDQLMTFPVFSTNISFLDLMGTAIKDFPSDLKLENLVEFSMGINSRHEEELERVEVQQLTSFKLVLFPTLTKLYLSKIPNLVELPYSIEILHQLKRLEIKNCNNLETLPTGINLQSLVQLVFNGCSRLTSFPDISTNIKRLRLNQTGIEVVPWWIEKFSRLRSLSMDKCKNLRCVSFNISKFKYLIDLDFQDCGALTTVDLCGSSFSPPENYVPKAKINFSHCFNIDPESLLQSQIYFFIKYMILPGIEEVPSYFNHRQTIGSSSPLVISLLGIPHYQPSFRVKICVMAPDCVYDSIGVEFQFKGEFGECYRFKDVSRLGQDVFLEYNHMLIYDYRLPRYKKTAPLDQRNYEHVNIKIGVDPFCGYDSDDQPADDGSIFWPKFGIQLCENDEYSYDTKNDEESDDSDTYWDTDSDDSDIDREDTKQYYTDNDDSFTDHENESTAENEKSNDSDKDCETEDGEETGDNNTEREKQETNVAAQLPISKKRKSRTPKSKLSKEKTQDTIQMLY